MRNDPYPDDGTRFGARPTVSAVKEAATQATDFIRRQADRRSRELGGRLSAAADELENAGDRSDGQDLITAAIARQLAQLARRVGYYLETTDTRTMLDDGRRFTREQPWTVVAIGVFAGFALSRLVKHAMTRDEDDT